MKDNGPGSRMAGGSKHFLVLTITLLLVGPILAGCLAPQADVEKEPVLPPVGLGLDVPETMPPPRAFQENPADLIELESFLLDEGYALLKSCGNAEDHHGVAEHVAVPQYDQALQALIGACAVPLKEQRFDIVRRAIAEGNEAEVLDELQSRALEAMAALEDGLAAFPGPGNAVEAEVLHHIMNRNEWNHAAINTALDMWGYYENGTARTELQLRNGYLGLLTGRANSETMLAIMDSYPWSGDQCRAPDVEALEARVRAKLDHAVVLAKERGDPEDANYVTENYGALVKSKVPRFEYYAERDWWVAMMHSEVEAEIAIAYWENLTAAAWPTEEEAEYMLALYRNQTRTIVTENLVRAHEYIFYFEHQDIPGRVDWANDTVAGAAAAPGFLSVLAARSPYTDMNCTTEG